MFGIGEFICYSISHYLISKRNFGRYRDQRRVGECEESFGEWRERVLERAVSQFPQHLIKGKTVLDFGCGGGQLSFLLRNNGAKYVIGIDLNSEALSLANRDNPEKDRISFVLGSDTTIPLPNESVDTIVCIAVLEHILNVDAILNEWHRILRPGGKVLIEWQPWYHPDGSHLGTLIPIPYAQCLFSERTLARVAYRLKQSCAFRPMFWDSMPGKESELPEQYCGNFLNKMSIAQFNRKLKGIPSLLVTEHAYNPPSWLPQIAPLLKLPFFCEFLTSYATYVLKKDEGE